MPNLRKLNPLRLSTALRRRPAGTTVTKAPALPPGTLVHVGEQKTDTMAIRVVEYDPGTVRDVTPPDVSACLPYKNTTPVTWLHVTGLHDVDQVAALGEAFGIHPLVLEDILNTRGRSKIEIFDDYIFVVSKLVASHHHADDHHVQIQHFAAVVLPNTVITFVEEPTTIFDPVVKRIKTGKGVIRRAGADYLAWAVIDALVDNYFGVIDALDETVTIMDDQLQEDAVSIEAGDLYAVRREVTGLHRLVRPLRELANALTKGGSTLLTAQSEPFFRDLYDHAVHAIERTEDLRDMTSSLRDFYLSAVSNRMNEVMKVLTCFATIFLPLTFLAGIYGMNFEHMPELGWKGAYPALWLAFIIIAGGMFVLFRRKKWL